MYANFNAEAVLRFGDEAKRLRINWTFPDYIAHNGLLPDGADIDDLYWSDVGLAEHHIAIEEIMAVEMSIFVFRRLPGCRGEVCDTLPSLRDRLVADYEEKTGYLINTGNRGRLA